MYNQSHISHLISQNEKLFKEFQEIQIILGSVIENIATDLRPDKIFPGEIQKVSVPTGLSEDRVKEILLKAHEIFLRVSR